MDFPIFKLQPDEVAAIWAILGRYPQYLNKSYELNFSVFGIHIHPSMRVSGLVKDLIGANPLA